MYFRYGGYAHDAGECLVDTPSPETIFSDDGVVTGLRQRISITGRKHAANPAALTAALQAMEAAYSVQYQEGALCDDSGAVTAIAVPAGLARVVQPPAYVATTPGQWTTYVDYSIILEVVQTSAYGQEQFDFRENVTFQPPPFAPTNQEFVYRNPLLGEVQRQGAGIFTFTAVQSGEVSSKIFWQSPRSPNWPQHCHWKQSTTSYDRRHSTKNYWSYVTTWNYVFEAPYSLNQYPAITY